MIVGVISVGVMTVHHVPVIVVKKITNVLWTACICQLIFKNLNTYTTITKYKSAWKMFVCMTIIQSIKFLNNFISVGVMTVGVLSVGVMTLSPRFNARWCNLNQK
jgi:hypothetical protein